MAMVKPDGEGEVISIKIHRKDAETQSNAINHCVTLRPALQGLRLSGKEHRNCALLAIIRITFKRLTFSV